MKDPFHHLISAAAACLVLIGLLIGGSIYINWIETRYIHALAPMLLLESMNGSALQRLGIRQPDLLMVYGSSEMVNMDTENRALSFFKDYPTGFQVFEVAKGGTTCLNMAQDLAALGPDLKGKKVVISFTPVMFNTEQVPENAYWGDYSRVHSNETAFSPYLSMDLKRRAAKRMLDYPDTLEQDPLLHFALQQLDANTPFNDFIYALSTPLGQLNLQIIHLQDHWQVLNYIWNNPTVKTHVSQHPKSIDWNGAIEKAQLESELNTTNNPYGVENEVWTAYYQEFQPSAPGSEDQRFISDLDKSKEWGDLEILLSILKEMDAEPLIMSRPINGTIWQASGVSAEAQFYYYNKLEQMIKKYDMPLVDYREYTMDKYFNTDKVSHTSRKGWIYVNQTLDAFFHDMLH